MSHTLEELGIITDMGPVGGWTYPQAMPDGSIQRIPARGHCRLAKELVEEVSNFRANVGIPQGDVALDIARYIAKKSPENDRNRGRGIIDKPRPEPFVPLIERMRAWVDERLPLKPKLCDKTEANFRADICMGCPMNIRWETSCGACVQEIANRTMSLRNLVSYEYDEALLGCRVYGAPLGALIFLDRDELPAQQTDAPGKCWV